MTEHEPAHPEQRGAGEVGVHRRPMGEPLVNPGFSRNMAPQRMEGPQVIEVPIEVPIEGTEEERNADGPGMAAVRRTAADISTTDPRRSGSVSEHTRATASARPGTTLEQRREKADRPRTAPRRRKRPMMLLAASATFFLVLRRLLKKTPGRRGTRRRAPAMRRLPLAPRRRSRVGRRR